ncbi:unnamed protein product [Pleuronectes platessa]|uniref:Uncharacterized protein n=1 Tax=Pleuronectes platessa TaxID=8262 RepID=A0A9N7UNU1_PLEPL|nr:unnamed protein product [Pleuronectes platessa]
MAAKALRWLPGFTERQHEREKEKQGRSERGTEGQREEDRREDGLSRPQTEGRAFARQNRNSIPVFCLLFLTLGAEVLVFVSSVLSWFWQQSAGPSRAAVCWHAAG